MRCVCPELLKMKRFSSRLALVLSMAQARQVGCVPVAGKSTLNRLERIKREPDRYHKISRDPIAIKRLLIDLFPGSHERASREIILDLDATDHPMRGNPEGGPPRLL
jgi:hypothetical protein